MSDLIKMDLVQMDLIQIDLIKMELIQIESNRFADLILNVLIQTTFILIFDLILKRLLPNI